MWRLVSIRHVRCGETDGVEYFLVPPELTEEEIDEAVDNIVAEMISDAQAVQQAPENPGYGPKFEDHPDKTVSEIKADFAKRKEAYKEWKEANDHLTRSFAKRAEDAGFQPLWNAHDKEETGAYETDAYYGHNHGLSLKYKMWEPIG